MMLFLAIMGFFMLTMLACFYFPRFYTLLGVFYLFYFSGKLELIKGGIEIPITVVIFVLLAVVMLYLDWKNLRLNPFKK